MKYAIIVPAHNEEAHLPRLVESLLQQEALPEEIVLVDDNSSDTTPRIMKKFAAKHSFIRWVSHASFKEHRPGSKVVEAFNYGLKHLKAKVDVLVKLDADLELPPAYFSQIIPYFQSSKLGIAGGYCYEKNDQGKWELNHPMHWDHVRGGFKAYRKDCFKAIGGLRPAMGWDTVDELLAQYYGYEVKAIKSLHVRHHRPLGERYTSKAAIEQGKAFYQMRYGVLWSVLATVKGGWKKKSFFWFYHCLMGFVHAQQQALHYMVSPEEGKFIRTYRLKHLFKSMKKPS